MVGSVSMISEFQRYIGRIASPIDANVLDFWFRRLSDC